MEEYKPFTSLDPNNPQEHTAGYYNVEKTMTTTKNDCSVESKGTSITLTAKANQFMSSLSVADANVQATSWLKANTQAYANNIGTCKPRDIAWRGVNPSCIIESSTTLEKFDYMVVRYKWALGAGIDFDTFTGFINTGTEWDNKYMGYGHGNGNELKNKNTNIPYMIWAGDNTQANGIEACLVNFNKLTNDYPDLKTIQVRMAGAWFSSVGTGNIDIEITTYLGGTMSKLGYDVINTGGDQVQQLIFSKNIPKPPSWINDINKVTNIGYLTYTKNSATGEVVITY